MVFCPCYAPQPLPSKYMILPTIEYSKSHPRVLRRPATATMVQEKGIDIRLGDCRRTSDNLRKMSASSTISRFSRDIRLTSQRLASCRRLLGSGARVGKTREFGGCLCMLVLDMVRNGTISQCIFQTLCSRMILDRVGSRLSI